LGEGCLDCVAGVLGSDGALDLGAGFFLAGFFGAGSVSSTMIFFGGGGGAADNVFT